MRSHRFTQSIRFVAGKSVTDGQEHIRARTFGQQATVTRALGLRRVTSLETCCRPGWRSACGASP